MSATGTRPPLFDPDPEGFDASRTPAPQFPLRRSGGAPSYPKQRSSGGGPSSSPRWVRPFIFGGLVLIAIISLVSILGGGGDPGPTAPLSADDDATTDGSQVDTDPLAPQGDLALEAAAPLVDEVDVDDASGTPDASAIDAEDAAVPVGAGAAASTSRSPELQAATAFAVQFTHDYLNYDQSQPEIRERDLRAYLAPDLDPQLGWDGQGSQVAVLTLPIDTVVDGDAVVVTVAAQVTGRDAPRWLHLAVPLAQDSRGRWAVTAQPAYVPRPAAGNPEAAGVAEVDQALSSELGPAMESLFRAFGSDSTVTVAGVTAPDAPIRGLQGQVTFVGVESVRIHAGEDTRTGTVIVTWHDPVTEGSVTQTYTVQLAEVDGAWLVDAVDVG